MGAPIDFNLAHQVITLARVNGLFAGRAHTEGKEVVVPLAVRAGVSVHDLNEALAAVSENLDPKVSEIIATNTLADARGRLRLSLAFDTKMAAIRFQNLVNKPIPE